MTTDGRSPEVLIPADEIRTAVARLGQQICADYTGRPLTVLGVLTGSLILLADLIREIPLPLRVGLVEASSYRGEVIIPGELSLNTSLLPDITGRDVVLLDDILDTGRTLAAVKAQVIARGANSVRTAVLLWKQSRTTEPITPDYHCFHIPDVFAVGYGLDFNDEYRHLPYVGVHTGE